MRRRVVGPRAASTRLPKRLRLVGGGGTGAGVGANMGPCRFWPERTVPEASSKRFSGGSSRAKGFSTDSQGDSRRSAIFRSRKAAWASGWCFRPSDQLLRIHCRAKTGWQAVGRERVG